MSRKPGDDETPEQKRALYRGLATAVQFYDEDAGHPCDQLPKTTQFKFRKKRPITLAEFKNERRRAGCQLTEELIEDIGCIMDTGMTQSIAEALLGLSDKRVSNSLQRARKRRKAIEDWDERARGMSDADAESQFGPRPEATLEMVLEYRVKQAVGIGKATLIGAIIECVVYHEDYDQRAKAAQWMLERRFPKEWGRYAMRTDLEANDDTADSSGEAARAKLASVLDSMSDALRS